MNTTGENDRRKSLLWVGSRCGENNWHVEQNSVSRKSTESFLQFHNIKKTTWGKSCFSLNYKMYVRWDTDVQKRLSFHFKRCILDWEYIYSIESMALQTWENSLKGLQYIILFLRFCFFFFTWIKILLSSVFLFVCFFCGELTL